MISSNTATRLVLTTVFIAASGLQAANVYPEKYRFTNKETWEVPLATLPPGEYVIRVHDKLLNKEIFEVIGAKDGKVYSHFLAVPQQNGSSKETLTFWSSTTGNKAVRSWFIPSDSQAWEFVYPKEKAVELAKGTNQAIPAVDLGSMPTPNNPLLSSDDLRAVQLWLLTPKRVSGSDAVDIDAAKLTPEPVARAHAALRNHAPAAASGSDETRHMPQTASNFAGEIALGVLLLAFGGLVLRRGLRSA